MAAKTDKSFLLDTDQPATRRKLYRAIRALPTGIYAVDLSRRRWKAGDGQRAFYWGYLIVEVARLLGKDREQTDKILNALFLFEAIAVAGESVRVVRSFSDLDPVAVSKYFEDITGWVWIKYRVRLSAPDSAKRKAV